MTESKIRYFDSSLAIIVHDSVIDISGGLPGYNSDRIELLHSTLEHVQNDLYYPEFFDKITHLLYSINKNHVFIDGNKRSSLALSAFFLVLNGYGACVLEFFFRMEDVVVQVAGSKIDKSELKNIIQNIVEDINSA